jgi:hypothetical protein
MITNFTNVVIASEAPKLICQGAKRSNLMGLLRRYAPRNDDFLRTLAANI